MESCEASSSPPPSFPIPGEEERWEEEEEEGKEWTAEEFSVADTLQSGAKLPTTRAGGGAEREN